MITYTMIYLSSNQEDVHILRYILFFFLLIRQPTKSTHCISSAASDVYKRQESTKGTSTKRARGCKNMEDGHISKRDQKQIVEIERKKREDRESQKVTNTGDQVKDGIKEID
eukprot:TRINITY_DN35653_c0_g1_i1.p4 TRINITY_DN35653_c0_g1~~TRINITY_DN35653_c0_g1_i1.p4  ORF type:complete len:112 (+),score=19.03 TRINITY_DN35653_c0_g1_i1:7-342(+)